MNQTLSIAQTDFLDSKVEEIYKNIFESQNNILIDFEYQLNKSIQIYGWLIKEFKDQSVPINSNYIFQTVFSSFYGIRYVKNEWVKKFYCVMEKFRNEKNVLIATVIGELHTQQEPVQFSFISKMLNLINPINPIFDYNVSSFLKLCKTEQLEDVYQELCDYYCYLFTKDKVKNCIEAFDRAFSPYSNELGQIKKLDFLLWCAGNPKRNR